MKDPLFYLTEQVQKLAAEVAQLEAQLNAWKKAAEELYEALDPITRDPKDRDPEFEQYALQRYYETMNQYKVRPEPFDD